MNNLSLILGAFLFWPFVMIGAIFMLGFVRWLVGLVAPSESESLMRDYKKEFPERALNKETSATVFRQCPPGLSIGSVELLGEDRFQVDVRNGDTPISTGQSFKALRTYQSPQTMADWANPPKELFCEEVDVCVVDISWYGKTIETLDPGHTARLVVIGEGLDKLAVNKVLEPK